MATYVLVHGGGHGGWCYDRVSARLRAAGHLVHAPSLTGCGDRKHLVGADVDLDTHITDIVNLLDYEELTEVILVGHSYGGMVITGVGDRAAHRIGEMVYLDAAHPVDGESLQMTAPVQMEMAYRGAQVIDGVELVLIPMPGFAGFYGITDPADIAWADAKLTPHPWKCFAQPLALRNGNAVSGLPRTNINCTGSLANSPEDRRARQLDGDRNFEIDTGHDLMITEPARVAEILMTLA